MAEGGRERPTSAITSSDGHIGTLRTQSNDMKRMFIEGEGALKLYEKYFRKV